MSYVIAEGGGGWVDELQLVVVTESVESICLVHMAGCSTWLEGLGCQSCSGSLHVGRSHVISWKQTCLTMMVIIERCHMEL